MSDKETPESSRVYREGEATYTQQEIGEAIGTLFAHYRTGTKSRNYIERTAFLSRTKVTAIIHGKASSGDETLQYIMTIMKYLGTPSFSDLISQAKNIRGFERSV